MLLLSLNHSISIQYLPDENRESSRPLDPRRGGPRSGVLTGEDDVEEKVEEEKGGGEQNDDELAHHDGGANGPARTHQP